MRLHLGTKNNFLSVSYINTEGKPKDHRLNFHLHFKFIGLCICKGMNIIHNDSFQIQPKLRVRLELIDFLKRKMFEIKNRGKDEYELWLELNKK